MNTVIDAAPAPPAYGSRADSFHNRRHHRRRLLEGLAVCVARHGYAQTTIADIAAAAHVSKRTFYEHFADKQACMIALYESASEASRRQLRLDVAESLPWAEQVEGAVRRYFSHLATRPLLMRALFMEVLSLGPEGLRARRANLDALAEAIQHSAATQGVSLPAAEAAALIGMLSEWILLAIEQDRVAALPDDAPAVAAMLRAAILGRRLLA
jgi:AcrR family transcriptional regulator